MLTIAKIQEANVRRCEDAWHQIADWSCNDWAVAMGGEAGEALNVCKKIKRMEDGKFQSNNFQDMADAFAALGDELADVIHYATLLAARANIDLEKHLVDKFNSVSVKNGLPHRL